MGRQRMRVTIVAIGTRGDVWPYLALGLGLQRAGHVVTIATHVEFGTDIQKLGLGYRGVGGSPREALASPAGQRWLESGRNPFAFLWWRQRSVVPVIAAGVSDLIDACSDAQAVLFSPFGLPAARAALRKGVLCLGLEGMPIGSTRARSHLLVDGGRSLGGPVNLLTHSLVDRVARLQLRPALESVDRLLNCSVMPGSAPYQNRPVPMLYAYSPRVSPRPADWPGWRHVTGYWFLEPAADFTPPRALVEFLEAGPPPVWVGFGSMVARDAERLTGLVLAALRRVGQRGILQSGWSELGQRAAGPDFHVIGAVEHHWLFPRVAAVVHHGGGGTTAAGLRAGVPSVLTPFFFDQFYWANRVQALGVGPAPIPHRRLTVDGLAAALHQATTNSSIRTRAATLGHELRAENGVARAVELFEAYGEQHSSR